MIKFVNVKPYLILCFLLMSACAYSQAPAIQKYTPVRSPIIWDFGKVKEQFTTPYKLLQGADSGAIAFYNNKFWGRKLVGDSVVWVPFADSLTSSQQSMLTVQSIDERNAIPEDQRFEGLFTYVKDSLKTYQLKGGIANINWQEFTSGSLVLIDTVINNVFYGSLNGLRGLSDTAVKTGYINDHGGGIFAIDPLDNTSVDDTALTVVITATGKIAKRQNFDGVNYRVDWFIPPAADGDNDDKTTYIQQAINKAKDKTLLYTKSRIYRHNQINLPAGKNISIIDFNGAFIKPALIIRGGGGLYNFTANKTNITTGLYEASGTYNTIAPAIKHIGGYLFKNGFIDLEYTNNGFFVGSLIGSFNTIVDDIIVKDNKIENASLRGVAIYGIQAASDTSSFIRNVDIEDNEYSNFGPFNYVAVDTAAAIGDTIVAVRTTDSKPIIDKLAKGRYFLIGTAQKTTDTPFPDYVNTYATTNKILRLKGFEINQHDSTKARLFFTAGSYSSTTGYEDSTKGLTAPVIKNAMLIPAAGGEHSHLMFLPPMTGTSGSNKLTIASHTTSNDARMKNFYPGVQFVFNTVEPTAPSGRYTVTQVYADSIKFTPALNQNFTNATPVILGQPGDAMIFQGDLKNVVVKNNKTKGAGHAIAMSGYQRRGYYTENLETNYKIEDNDFDASWMHIEIGGVPLAATNMRADASNLIVDSAAHYVTITNPANYKMLNKDFGFGAIKTLTGSSIADGSVVVTNSFSVGDIISWTGVHLSYKIVDFDTTGGVKKMFIARFDNTLKDTIPGGFETNSTDNGTIRRLFSIVNGGAGIIRKADFVKNKFGDITRVAGGYAISGGVYENNIENNEFNIAERTALELEGDAVKIINNKFYQPIFTGNVPRYSITTGGSGRGALYATLYSASVMIKGNEFNLLMPGGTGYYNVAGALSLGVNSGSINPQRELTITENTFNGVRSRLIDGGNTVVPGTQISSFYYDKVNISNNNIDLHEVYPNATGLFGYLYSPNTDIKGNTITKKFGNPLTSIRVFYNGTYLPQALNINTPLKVNVEGNTYPVLPTFGLSYDSTKYWWNDKNNRSKILNEAGWVYRNANGFDSVGTPPAGNVSIADGFLVRGTGTNVDSTQLYYNSLLKRLGYGTSNPQYQFHYVGDSAISTTAEFRWINPMKTGTRLSKIGAVDGNGIDAYMRTLNGVVRFGTSANATVYFEQNNVIRGLINTSGNWGIGTNSAAYPLTVGTPGTNAGEIGLAGATSGYVRIVPADATTTYQIKMPAAAGAVGKILKITSVAGSIISTDWADDNNSGGGGGGGTTSQQGTFY